MRSMTGFGKGVSSREGGFDCDVEISSVNRKQLDVRCGMGAEYSFLEPPFRKKIAQALSRGAVSLRFQCRLGVSGAAVNRPLLENLAREALDVQRQLGLDAVLDVAGLMRLPGVLGAGIPEAGEELLTNDALEALDRALEALDAMRRTEGAALRTDLQARREHLSYLLSRIREQLADYPSQQRNRLLEKLQAENLPVVLDDERLLRELVYYLDKGDVSEEITRLESHFLQLDRFFADESTPVGRSLDFLMQEMFREITTLGNKASLPAVTPLVVEFKTELEKMREQVQNVE